MQLKGGLFVNESISYSSSRMKLVLGLDGCCFVWPGNYLLICYLNLEL